MQESLDGTWSNKIDIFLILQSLSLNNSYLFTLLVNFNTIPAYFKVILIFRRTSFRKYLHGEGGLQVYKAYSERLVCTNMRNERCS